MLVQIGNKILIRNDVVTDIIHFSILVHPCDKANNGGCSQLCKKRKEWHVCSCKAGFVLVKDNRTCKRGKNILY